MIWIPRAIFCVAVFGLSGCSLGFAGQGMNEVDVKYRGQVVAQVGSRKVEAVGVGPVVLLVDGKRIDEVACFDGVHVVASLDGKAVFLLCIGATYGSFWVIDSQGQLSGPRDFCSGGTLLAGYETQKVRETYLSSTANCR
jgi:hypothetical protein